MQVTVKALTAMQYVQSVELHFCTPPDVKADPAGLHDPEQVSLALRDLLLKVLLPHVPDPAVNMTEVYRLGLPVMLKSLGEGLCSGGVLADLLEGLLDRMVTQQDLVTHDVETMAGGLLPAILELTDNMFYNFGKDKSLAHLQLLPYIQLRLSQQVVSGMLHVALCAFTAAESLCCCKNPL